MADKLNQVVCLDLKEHIHNKTGILHMTDSATRYSEAYSAFSKQQDGTKHLPNVHTLFWCT